MGDPREELATKIVDNVANTFVACVEDDAWDDWVSDHRAKRIIETTKDLAGYVKLSDLSGDSDAFRALAAAVHQGRCTGKGGDCEHLNDLTYFTPKDNDIASAVAYAGRSRTNGFRFGVAAALAATPGDSNE